MGKNDKRALTVLGIIFVAFSVIVFAIPFEKDMIFFLSYFFALIAIVAQVYVLKTAFRNGVDTSARSKFYGYPIAQVGVIYAIVQLIASIAFMIINTLFVNGVGAGIQEWIAIIVYVLIFAGAAIGFISTDAMRDEIERQDVKLSKDTTCMTTLRSIIYPLAGQIDDSEAKKVLNDLADDFRYSDPVSSSSIETIEAQLSALVDELHSAVMESDASSVISISKNVKNTLIERNRLCKLGKGK